MPVSQEDIDEFIRGITPLPPAMMALLKGPLRMSQLQLAILQGFNLVSGPRAPTQGALESAAANIEDAIMTATVATVTRAPAVPRRQTLGVVEDEPIVRDTMRMRSIMAYLHVSDPEEAVHRVAMMASEMDKAVRAELTRELDRAITKAYEEGKAAGRIETATSIERILHPEDFVDDAPPSSHPADPE
jgi:hypothetical protein